MFYTKFVKLCNERDVSPSAAAEQMGLSRAANTKWAAGQAPRKATMQKIADYFGVPVEYFSEEAQETEKSPMPNDIGEENILRMYRSLSTEEKGALYAYALSLKEKQKEGK